MWRRAYDPAPCGDVPGNSSRSSGTREEGFRGSFRRIPGSDRSHGTVAPWTLPRSGSALRSPASPSSRRPCGTRSGRSCSRGRPAPTTGLCLKRRPIDEPAARPRGGRCRRRRRPRLLAQRPPGRRLGGLARAPWRRPRVRRPGTGRSRARGTSRLPRLSWVGLTDRRARGGDGFRRPLLGERLPGPGAGDAHLRLQPGQPVGQRPARHAHRGRGRRRPPGRARGRGGATSVRPGGPFPGRRLRPGLRRAAPGLGRRRGARGSVRPGPLPAPDRASVAGPRPRLAGRPRSQHRGRGGNRAAGLACVGG